MAPLKRDKVKPAKSPNQNCGRFLIRPTTSPLSEDMSVRLPPIAPGRLELLEEGEQPASMSGRSAVEFLKKGEQEAPQLRTIAIGDPDEARLIERLGDRIGGRNHL